MKDIVRYLGIDKRTQLLAECLWHLLEEPSGEIIAAFYRDSRQSAVGMLFDEPTISRLQSRQKEHWCALFKSHFNESYQRSATLIAIKHRELGLEPKWYVAGYALIKVGFIEVLLKAELPPGTKQALIAKLEKYVAIDMALSLSIYSSWLVD
jgi:hypothetical protein